MLVLDAEGQVVAHTGYQPGGPEHYVKQLAGFVDAYGRIVKMKEELATAAGLDRARLLDKLVSAYLSLGSEDDHLTEWDKEIVRLDLGNKTGLRPKHEFRPWMAIYEKRMDDHKLVDAKKALDKALAVNGIGTEQKRTAREKLDQIKPLVEAMEAIAKSKQDLEGAEGLDRAKILDTYLEAQAKLFTFMKLTPSDAATQNFMKEGPKLAKEIVKLDKQERGRPEDQVLLQAQDDGCCRAAKTGSFAKARAAVGPGRQAAGPYRRSEVAAGQAARPIAQDQHKNLVQGQGQAAAGRRGELSRIRANDHRHVRRQRPPALQTG